MRIKTALKTALGVAFEICMTLLSNARYASDECLLPTGDFHRSCININTSPYTSSDPNVPQACKVMADCPTMFSGLPLQRNVGYFPSDIRLDGVTNNNGTLTHKGKPLSARQERRREEQEHRKKFKCHQPRRAYKEICKTNAVQYESSDPNLDNTELCEAQIDCADLNINGKSKSSVVYFNRKTEQSGERALTKCLI